jgi:hypothetical protein
LKNKNILVFGLIFLALCLLALCIGGFLLWRGMKGAVSSLPNLVETAAPQIPTAAPMDNPPATAVPSTPFVLGAAPVIHLAGRTDIPIPPLEQPSDISLFSCRPAGLVQRNVSTGLSHSARRRVYLRCERQDQLLRRRARRGLPA